MASSSMLKNGLTSPIRTVMKTGSGTRSILRRPAALPMSPQAFPVAATFSVQLNSPHVHFPASPAMVATFKTYSASSYDRGAIPASPNPFATPIFSPSLRGFKLTAPPRPFRSLSYQASPAIEDFEDPRSPKLQPVVKSSSIRFAPFPTADHVLGPKPRPRDPLSTYPRSPYLSAPLETTEAKEARLNTQPARDEFVPRKRNKNGLSLASRRTSGFPSISSPLNQSFTSFTPTSTINRVHKPAPLDLNAPESARLSDEFWKSVSVEPDSADEPMVTALEYPQSAVNYEAHQDNEMRSATATQILYAGGDGVPLWSPRVPKVGAKIGKIRESLMSPAVQRPSFLGVARREITAPSPNDPFAAFPSFTVALEQGGISGAIQYPPPVVQRG
jgi:hypothetical protein